MYEIPAGIEIEIVRPEQAGADLFDWDDTVVHITKRCWLIGKERLVIDPIDSIGPSVGGLIGFVMHGADHDTDFGRWEGAIILADAKDCPYVD